MRKKLVNWFKAHKRLRVAIPSVMLLVMLLVSAVPYAFADWSLDYPDVTGTYLIASGASPRELDGDRHPRVQFNRLIITTQVDKAITVATLEHMGTDIALTGMVGPGSRPSIVLGGTDTDGTVTAIQARVIIDRNDDVTSLSGRMTTYVTSDGSRWEDSADGTSAISAVAYHSEPLSTLLVGGTDGNPKALVFHNPYSRLQLRQLSSIRSGQLGFWFNLEAATTIGPEIMLRFAPRVRGEPTIQSYYGGGTAGLVDITIMPYQAPYAGTGAWVECDLAEDDATIIYYGNDPTDFTGFGGTPLSSLADVEAAINAEVAMTADTDSASAWVLTMVSIELWEAGDRDCYIDDVTIGGQLYNLEPNSYMASFRAIMQ